MEKSGIGVGRDDKEASLCISAALYSDDNHSRISISPVRHCTISNSSKTVKRTGSPRSTLSLSCVRKVPSSFHFWQIVSSMPGKSRAGGSDSDDGGCGVDDDDDDAGVEAAASGASVVMMAR